MPEKSLPKDVFKRNDSVDFGLLKENTEWREKLKQAGMNVGSSYRLSPPLGGSRPTPKEEGSDNPQALRKVGVPVRRPVSNWVYRPALEEE